MLGMCFAHNTHVMPVFLGFLIFMAVLVVHAVLEVPYRRMVDRYGAWRERMRARAVRSSVG